MVDVKVIELRRVVHVHPDLILGYAVHVAVSRPIPSVSIDFSIGTWTDLRSRKHKMPSTFAIPRALRIRHARMTAPAFPGRGQRRRGGTSTWHRR
jgi:hypothetical protein